MIKKIEKTKKHIKRILPKSQAVDIDIKRNQTGNFVSKIHVKTPQKVMHAQKTDPSFMGSLDKSYQAIVRQIHKYKTKKQRRHSEPLSEHFESA